MRGIVGVIITFLLAASVYAADPQQTDLQKAQAQALQARGEAALAKRDLARVQIQLAALNSFLAQQADAQSKAIDELMGVGADQKAFEDGLKLPKDWRYNWQTLQPEKIPDEKK